MVLSDRLTGAAWAVLGAVIVLYARGLPEPAGAASPRLFPMIVGALIVVTGVLIVLRSLRGAGAVGPTGQPDESASRDAAGGIKDPQPDRAPSNGWLRDPRKLGMVLGAPVLIIAYGLLAPVLGALLMSMLVITIYALLWSERLLPALLTGVIVGFVVVAFFAWGMNVQLPRGVLGVAL